MGYRLTIFIIFVNILGCKISDQKVLDRNNVRLLPPGCVKISSNFYADKNEVTNIGYKEYQYWVAKIFGKNSKEYEQTTLDTKVWERDKESSQFVSNYEDDLIYSNYPVVGITLEQATLFTKWRTDRVAEIMLIEAGLMKPNVNQNSKNYFTLNKYLNGSYKYSLPESRSKNGLKEIAIPEYKIPNSEEWELITGVESKSIEESYSVDKYNKSVLKKYRHLFNTREYHESKWNKKRSRLKGDEKKMFTSPSRSFGKNKYGLYGIIGNVSELVEEKGISKGGNWKTVLSEISIEQNNQFEEADNLTGFRNVCYIKKIKLNKNGS